MRLSANHESPFYVETAIANARVLLNGVDLFGCVEACEEEGWADCLVIDVLGHPVVDGDGYKIERRTGVVLIMTEHR